MTSTSSSAPVRVKVYGLISLTRRTYLIVQAVGLVLGLVALGLGLFLPRPEAQRGGPPLPPSVEAFVAFLDLLPWMALLLLAAGCLETVVVLAKFRKKEDEQKALRILQEPLPPPPAEKSGTTDTTG
jgi:hypothetical protein